MNITKSREKSERRHTRSNFRQQSCQTLGQMRGTRLIASIMKRPLHAYSFIMYFQFLIGLSLLYTAVINLTKMNRIQIMSITSWVVQMSLSAPNISIGVQQIDWKESKQTHKKGTMNSSRKIATMKINSQSTKNRAFLGSKIIYVSQQLELTFSSCSRCVFSINLFSFKFSLKCYL